MTDIDLFDYKSTDRYDEQYQSSKKRPRSSDNTSTFNISIPGIIIAALLFVIVLAWTETFRMYYDTFILHLNNNQSEVLARFYYNLILTIMIIFIIGVIYRFQ